MADLDDLYGTPPDPPANPPDRRGKRARAEPPSGDYPDWYTPSKERQEANKRVLRGLHPMGRPLTPYLDAKCGSCVHLTTVTPGARSFHKCAISAQTRGPSTDVRLKWLGCERWWPAKQSTRCSECGTEGLRLVADDVPNPQLACDGCGGMFDLDEWVRKAPPSSQCHYVRADGRSCRHDKGHRGPHEVG